MSTLTLRGTGDAAGYFAFGDPSNLEVMVKAIDDGAHGTYCGGLNEL